MIRDKLIDVLPPRGRRIYYVALSLVSAIGPAWAALDDGFQAHDLPVLAGALLAGGGFTMAAANTQVPPAG